MATQTTASGVLCGLVMVGPSPCVDAEHTHSTGDLRLTMANRASVASLPSACWSTPLVSKNTLVPEVLRTGVRSERSAGVAGESRNGDAIHRAGKSLREAAVACLAAWISIATASEKPFRCQANEGLRFDDDESVSPGKEPRHQNQRQAGSIACAARFRLTFPIES